MIRSYASGPAQTVGSVICTNLLSSKAAEALDIAEVRPLSLWSKCLLIVTSGPIIHEGHTLGKS